METGTRWRTDRGRGAGRIRAPEGTLREVLADFRTLVHLVRGKLPETRIAYISIKPSLDRWALVGEMRRANAMIRGFCSGDPLLDFIDVDAPMIGPDGRPRPELFVEDGLHLSRSGYNLWKGLLWRYVMASD